MTPKEEVSIIGAAEPRGFVEGCFEQAGIHDPSNDCTKKSEAAHQEVENCQGGSGRIPTVGLGSELSQAIRLDQHPSGVGGLLKLKQLERKRSGLVHR